VEARREVLQSTDSVVILVHAGLFGPLPSLGPALASYKLHLGLIFLLHTNILLLLSKTNLPKWGMVLTVHTISGTDVTGADFSATDEVKTAKDALSKHLGVVPSRLMLLHDETILKDTLVLEDVCGDNSSETCLTVIIFPQLTGIFYFETSCARANHHLSRSKTGASIVAVFKDGTADIIVKECLCLDDEDPYLEYGASLARYTGFMRYIDQDDFSIDVTLCQRGGIYNELLATSPSVIQGKWCADEKDISLQIVLAAGGRKRSADNKTWITLQQREKLPAEYGRNVQEVAQVDIRRKKRNIRIQNTLADWIRQQAKQDVKKEEEGEQ